MFAETQHSRVPGFLLRLGSDLHWRTTPSTVQTELLFAPGQPCDPERLAETARLLRAQSFIRSATITPTAAPGDSVDLTVRTLDDWALRGEAKIEGGGRNGPLRRLRLGDENLFGRGLRAQFRLNTEGRIPGFDADVSTHEFFGRHDADVLFGNSGVGLVAQQLVLRPFSSEFDRFAWREVSGYRKEPFYFQSPALGSVVLPMVTTGADLGVAGRFGQPGGLAVVGGLLSYERLFPEGSAFASLPEDDSIAAQALQGRYTEQRRVRAHILLGARTLKFVQRTHLDAVNAVEDIRLGFEGGVIAGKSLFGGDGLQHDEFGSVELYAGAAPGNRTLVFLRGKWEGRWLETEHVWDNVIGSADLIAYRMTSPTTTYVAGVSAAGGWNTSNPFQLTLGALNGIRGYGSAAFPVGQRVVFHASRRHFAGVLFGAIDVGTTLFADVGQGWAGDVPFGTNTDVVGSLGGGLRLAFPSGSRVTYRIDLAVPVRNGHGVQLLVGVGQQFGVSRGEADDVTRSREQVSSVTLFNFPRF